MKDYCLELGAAQKSDTAKYNIMREYLQAYVLKIMHDRKAFASLAFVGGTALRFLYKLPRFSEDLDFSLHKDYVLPFGDLMSVVKKELMLAGYDVEVAYRDNKTVQSSLLKFEGLMYEAKLSPMKSQKNSIKIEVDTNPPQGAGVVTQIVDKFFPIAFLTYDLPSLLAGKMHALLSRKYLKGRDYFDIAWYLLRFKELSPNFELLHNALKQTGYLGEFPNPNNWRECLYEIVKKADWKIVDKDVTVFLEETQSPDVFSKENVLGIISQTSIAVVRPASERSNLQ